MGKKSKLKKNKLRKPAITQENSVEQVFEIIFFVLIVVTVIIVPLAFTTFTYDPFDLIKNVIFRILVSLTLLTFVSWVVFSKSKKINFHPVIYLLIVFLIGVSISTYFAVEPWLSFWGKYRRYEGWVAFLAYGTFLSLLLQNFGDKRRVELVTKVALWTGAVISLYGIAQYLGFDFLRWGALPFEERRSFASLGNPALLAGYLVTILPIGVALTIFSRKTYDIVLNSTSTILVFICLIATFNRTSWLATLLALIFMAGAIIYLWKRGAVHREAIQNLLIIVVALIIFFVAFSIQSRFARTPITVTERIKEITVLTGSFQHRLEIWGAGARMVADRPFLGFGPDSFRATSRIYQGPNYGHIAPDVVADNAHNYELQISSGTGMLGFLLFAAIVCYVFFEGFVLTFRRSFNKNGAAHLESSREFTNLGTNLGLFTSFLAYLFQLTTSVSIIGSTIMWWLAFGLILCQSESLRTLKFPSRKQIFETFKWVAIAFAGFLFLITSFYNVKLVVADNHYYKGRGYLQFSPYVAEGEIEVRKAMEVNPWFFEYPLEIARAYYRSYLSNKNPDDLERAIAYAEVAHELDKHEADTRSLLVQIYIMKASYEPEVYERAKYVALNMVKDMPYHYVSHLSLGIIYFRLQEYSLAEEEFIKAIELNPNSAICYAYLGEINMEKGNRDMAQQYFNKAIELDPDLKESLTTGTDTTQ